MQQHILDMIVEERARQDAKWGRQRHEPFFWLTILMEEVGEAAKAALQGKVVDLGMELVQVAAVCVAWLEQLLDDDG